MNERSPDRAGPGARRRGGDEPTRGSALDELLTPPGGSSGPGEPTQGLPVHLSSLANGRYVLGRQLGAGGMGIVRVARDEVLHREVAVKLLADNLAADAEARERFLREARAAARIHDPHVVAVHDVGDEAGRPYLVMELVDGPSLADVLATRGRLEPAEVVGVASQALAGLTCAHEAGLLHRDIKPGNLLQHPDGILKVTDFGVAEAVDTPGMTRTGFVLGTRSYLAPERRGGRPADARTDLYALGATLVEVLTGRPPDVDDGYELPDDTPSGLRRLVTSLMAEDPADRPADTGAALDLLAGEGGPTAERAASALDEDAAVPRDAVAADHTETLPVEADGSTPERSDGPVIPWRTVAAIGVALLALVVAIQLATGDRSPANTTAGDPIEDGATGDPIEDGATSDPIEDGAGSVEIVEEDPEATARNLAEWLREHTAND